MEVEKEIYEDLSHGELTDEVEKLQHQNNLLLQHIQSLQTDIEKLCAKILEMKTTQDNLAKNISALYKTAKTEIERKDKIIADLRTKLDHFMIQTKTGNLTYKRDRDINPSVHNREPVFKKIKTDSHDKHREKKNSHHNRSRSRSMSREGLKHSHRDRNKKDHRSSNHLKFHESDKRKNDIRETIYKKSTNKTHPNKKEEKVNDNETIVATDKKAVEYPTKNLPETDNFKEKFQITQNNNEVIMKEKVEEYKKKNPDECNEMSKENNLLPKVKSVNKDNLFGKGVPQKAKVEIKTKTIKKIKVDDLAYKLKQKLEDKIVEENGQVSLFTASKKINLESQDKKDQKIEGCAKNVKIQTNTNCTDEPDKIKTVTADVDLSTQNKRNDTVQELIHEQHKIDIDPLQKNMNSSLEEIPQKSNEEIKIPTQESSSEKYNVGSVVENTVPLKEKSEHFDELPVVRDKGMEMVASKCKKPKEIVSKKETKDKPVKDSLAKKETKENLVKDSVIKKEMKEKSIKEHATKKEPKEKIFAGVKNDKCEEEVPESDRVLRSATRRNSSKEKSIEKLTDQKVETTNENSKSSDCFVLINDVVTVNLTHEGEIPVLHIYEPDKCKTEAEKNLFDINLNMQNTTSTPVATTITNVNLLNDLNMSSFSQSGDESMNQSNIEKLATDLNQSAKSDATRINTSSDRRTLNTSDSCRKRRRVVLTMND